MKKQEQSVDDDAEYYEAIEGVKLYKGELSADDFKKIQKKLGVTNIQMAAELKLQLRSICYYRSGERKIPPPIQKLLRFVTEEYGFTF